MLASSEPKITSLPKCVPSVLVLGGIVFRAEEYTMRTYFRLRRFSWFILSVSGCLIYICFPHPQEGSNRKCTANFEAYMVLYYIILSLRAFCLGILCIPVICITA